MQSRSLAWFAGALLVCVGAANAEVYKWKDSRGRWVFSDRPPAGASAEPLKMATPLAAPARDASAPAAAKAAPAGAPITAEDVVARNRKIEEENNRLRDSNCAVARSNLRVLESVRKADPGALASARQTVQEWCTK